MGLPPARRRETEIFPKGTWGSGEAAAAATAAGAAKTVRRATSMARSYSSKFAAGIRYFLWNEPQDSASRQVEGPEGREETMSLNERLQLEMEILERLDRIRSLEETEVLSEDIEKEIIERELAELEEQLEPEPALVLRRKRRS